MKNLKFNFKLIVRSKARWLLTLIAILTLGVGQMWAYNEYGKKYLYVNVTDCSWWNDYTNAIPHINGYDDYACNTWKYNMLTPTGNPETNVWYFDLSTSSYGSYTSTRGFELWRYSDSGEDSWYKVGFDDGKSYNCLWRHGDYVSFGNYAPPMASVTITNTSTVYGGDGSEAKPYKIKKGTTLTVSASSTSSVPGDAMTKYYEFYYKQGSGAQQTWQSSSTTTTSPSLTVSSTVGVTYEIEVKAQNEYYGYYGTKASNKMYFITVDPIYAILGSFNNWDRSAATWDLVDQGSGSNNWDATFDLDKGSYTFKVVFNSTHYGNGATISRASSSTTGLSTSGDNMTITADVTGEYTFRYNSSDKTLAVTYPTAYAIDISHGWKAADGRFSANTNPASAKGGTITSAVASASGSITNGENVASGENVVFTHSTEATGYSFLGWGSTFNNGTNPPSYTAYVHNGTTIVINDASKTLTLNNIGAAKHVYSFFKENVTTVTVNAAAGHSGYGSLKFGATDKSWGATTTVGVTTTQSITAVPNTGYKFKQWTLTGGATLASGNLTDATITIKGNGTDGSTGTAVAEFELRYAVLGSVYGTSTAGSGMPGWSDYTKTLTYQAANDFRRTLTLKGNTKYKFRIRDLSNGNNLGGESEYNISLNGTHTTFDKTGGDVTFTTEGSGDITFQIDGFENGYPQVKLIAATSPRTITFGSRSVYNEGASADNSTNGGSIAVVDGYTYSLTSGQYVENGGTAVFTAKAETGYTFAGWYSNSTCTTEIEDNDDDIEIEDNVLTLSKIGANKTVYAKFAEKMTTVALDHNAYGHVQNASSATITSIKAGVHTHPSITAVPNTGYYFSGWTVKEGSDFTPSATGEANTTITISGGGNGETSGQTLTANFTELEKIYFRDVFDDGSTVTHWGDVYVYLGITWNGSKQAVTNSSHDDWRIHMTQIKGTNVWWAYVPRNFTTAAAGTKEKVGFTKTNQNGRSYTFYNTKAATRGDYNKALNMFVPYHTAKTTGNNGVDYFDNGYWMKYDTRANNGAGYYLKRFNSTNNYTQEGEFYATNDDATFIQFSLRIDAPNSDRDYMITSSGGLNYLASSKVTSANNSDIVMNEDLRTLTDNDVKFTIHTTSEGYYTFVIDQSGDKMKLNVIYPVSVGDYKLVHEYTVDAVDKTSHSDVIKAADASGKTVSMYLNMDAAKSLKLYKCTAITNGYPVWNSYTTVGTGTGLFNTTTFNKGKGVYVFDVAIATDAVSSISNAGLYTGDFYIKTDCAPGGWANYTQNILEKNTINATAAGFDYYMCKWIGNTTTNVKCVIANDYNNEITDTLKSDDILTRNAIAYETLPGEAANVRFSYDTKTNTLKRTYLLGSSMSEKYIYLVPNAADYVYSAATSGTDYYSSNPKFEDNGNWTYQMDAYVYPGAKAGVKTNYPKAEPITVQTLIDPTTNYLMGGTTKGSTRYHVRLVYDFKTDYLMSAYMPDGLPVTTSIDLQTDMMYVRSGEGASTQLSFSGSGELKNVKRAYGVFEFPKDQMSGQMSSWAANSYRAYKYCRYYFSFPFDVNIKDIFGVGEYGKEFIIQTYNGVKRAQIGWFMETDSFWETMDVNETLKANTGYSLMLDREEFNRSDGKGVWTNIADGKAIYLFFPSTSTTLGTIDAASGTFTVEEHAHTSGRTWTKDANTLNHDDTDSNWGMIGLPAYASTYPNNGTKKLDKCYTYQPDGVNFNTWQVTDLVQGSSLLKSMHAYMVQYAGTFSWTTVAPSPIAARTLDTNTNMTIRLNLQYNGEEADRAFVKLQDGSDKGFVLNEDLYKMVNKGKTNIYVYAGDYDVAYSTTPVESQTIEVGVIIAKKGTYTFSMPEGINGTVTLIDTYTQTRTNLSLEDYEVYLNKGTINDRFLLEIDINKVTTDVVTVSGDRLEESGIRKFIYDNQLYIMKNGIIYDARGNRKK